MSWELVQSTGPKMWPIRWSEGLAVLLWPLVLASRISCRPRPDQKLRAARTQIFQHAEVLSCIRQWSQGQFGGCCVVCKTQNS